MPCLTYALMVLMTQEVQMAQTTPSGPRTTSRDEQSQILEMVPPLRRFVASRVDSAQDIDDIVQETLSRVLTAEEHLEEVSLTAYAFTVARNLLTTGHRDAAVARRHAPKLVDRREPDRQDDELLAAEDRKALRAALDTLPAEHREQLLEHVLNERPLVEMATSAPSLAAQLGRTRARLRLDYLLALRQVTLATPRCRPVLLAVSAGDRRRQQALHAGSHLLYCSTCSDLSEPLLQRRRALAGVVPWVPLGALHGHLVRIVKDHPVGTGVAAVVAAGVITSAALTGQLTRTTTQDAPVAPPAATAGSPSVAPSVDPAVPSRATLTGPRGSVLGATGALADLVGSTVTARGVRVLAVPADEGFWVGDATAKVWVQLERGPETRLRVLAGQRLDFVGVVVGHGAAFAREAGVEPAEGAGELTRQRAHLRVDPAGVRVLR